MKIKYLMVLILSLLLLASFLGCARAVPTSQPPTPTPTPTTPPPQEEYDIKTDPSGLKYIVDPDKIVGGGPPIATGAALAAQYQGKDVMRHGVRRQMRTAAHSASSRKYRYLCLRQKGKNAI